MAGSHIAFLKEDSLLDNESQPTSGANDIVKLAAQQDKKDELIKSQTQPDPKQPTDSPSKVTIRVDKLNSDQPGIASPKNNETKPELIKVKSDSESQPGLSKEQPALGAEQKEHPIETELAAIESVLEKSKPKEPEKKEGETATSPQLPQSTFARLKNAFYNSRCVQAITPSQKTRDWVDINVRYRLLSLYPVDLKTGWKSKAKNFCAWGIQNYFAYQAAETAYGNVKEDLYFMPAEIVAVPLACVAYWVTAKGFGSFYKVYQATENKLDQFALLFQSVGRVVNSAGNIVVRLIKVEEAEAKLKAENVDLRAENVALKKHLVTLSEGVGIIAAHIDRQNVKMGEMEAVIADVPLIKEGLFKRPASISNSGNDAKLEKTTPSLTMSNSEVDG